jgi:beta-galactosidase
VPLEAAGTELLTGEPATARLDVPAGAVRVVRLDG